MCQLTTRLVADKYVVEVVDSMEHACTGPLSIPEDAVIIARLVENDGRKSVREDGRGRCYCHEHTE
jgi:hypothetical protein